MWAVLVGHCCDPDRLLIPRRAVHAVVFGGGNSAAGAIVVWVAVVLAVTANPRAFVLAERKRDLWGRI